MEQKVEQDAKRQQDKIIATVMRGNTDIIGQHEVMIRHSDREAFLSAIQSGAYGMPEWRNLISHIAGPTNLPPEYRKTTDQIFAEMSTGKKADASRERQEKRILAYMTGLGFEGYNGASGESVKKFLSKFPEPMDFEEASNAFMHSLSKVNTPAKYQEYEKSMADFKNRVYGKKQEYWEQVKSLQHEAQCLSAKVEGDPFVSHGRTYQLTPEHLLKNSLAPAYDFNIEGTQIGLSKAFDDGDGHDACIAYVHTKDGIKARTYYRSRSAGMWRYLPDYLPSGNGYWYGKGNAEESLSLPFGLQSKLNEIISSGNKAKIGHDNPDFFLLGTAKRYNDFYEYGEGLRNHTLRGDQYQEVSNFPELNLGKLSQSKEYPGLVGESLMSGPKEPDYTRELDSYNMRHEMYGTVKVRLYKSKDGALNYTMCETGQGGSKKAWVGSIEAVSPISSTGCRTEWVSMGDVGTPLYEYDSQDGGYGDYTDTKGSYVSMWKNYISKMPLIRKYLAESRE